MRIFWLGMHKILKPTELRWLRELGYEVFNPPYRSDIYDQSADLSRDEIQETTLPEDVFKKLHSYDFFYKSVSEEISEILNSYFDVVIVTINPDWLLAMEAAFRGPMIFRTYGQPYNMSDYLVGSGLWRRLQARDNFHIVPFANESIEEEHEWFHALCSAVVPYQIPDEVFDCELTWQKEKSKKEIAVSIPNIDNPYYGSHYRNFASKFSESYFRILGPQRTFRADPRILGEISRERFLQQLAQSRGYFYTYTDNVCYLPPIEMMQIGGPVIFMPGSLLARFGDPKRPGAALGIDDARRQSERLVQGDWIFASEVIAAQEPVRERYDRNIVRPLFEKAFKEILDNATTKAEKKQESSPQTSIARGSRKKTLLVLLHIDGFFHSISGRAVALEGIPRVVEAIVNVVREEATCHIVLTCTSRSEAVLNRFFSKGIQSGIISLLVIDHISNESIGLPTLHYVSLINSGAIECDLVFVPHYYLFPESILIRKEKVLYLPDYFPHLMPGVVFDQSAEKDRLNKRVGNAIGQQASCILTNSMFSASYIPAAGFCEPDAANDKIVVAPLPLLGAVHAPHPIEVSTQIPSLINGRAFIFYPTANRPNKKLAFLMRVLAHLRLLGHELYLVLTCELDTVAEVKAAYNDYNLRDSVILKTGLSEAEMLWCYNNCSVMCLTSVAEGNFPPQMLEALHYGAPIVASRLPTVTELVGADDGGLLLCRPLELVDFVDKIEIALAKRDEVLTAQEMLLRQLSNSNSLEAFRDQLKRAFHQVM